MTDLTTVVTFSALRASPRPPWPPAVTALLLLLNRSSGLSPSSLDIYQFYKKKKIFFVLEFVSGQEWSYLLFLFYLEIQCSQVACGYTLLMILPSLSSLPSWKGPGASKLAGEACDTPGCGDSRENQTAC